MTSCVLKRAAVKHNESFLNVLWCEAMEVTETIKSSAALPLFCAESTLVRNEAGSYCFCINAEY